MDEVTVERLVWDGTAFVRTGQKAVGHAAELNDLVAEIQAQIKAKRPMQTERFLKGPIPWWWMEAAAPLSRSAILVGLCLWQLAGYGKGKAPPTVKLNNEVLASLGINKMAKSRGLAELEAAGLIEVKRIGERAFPVVTLIVPDGAASR